MDSKLKMLKNYRYFLVYIIFFFLSLLVINEKTYLLVFLLAITTFFVFFKHNLFDSTFLTLLLALPFEKSIRYWILYAPSNNNLSLEGYYLYFGLTPKLILGLLLLLLIFSPKVKRLLSNTCFHAPQKLLMIFFVVSFLLSITNSTQPFYIFTGFIQLALAIAFYLFAYSFFSRPNHQTIFTQFILALIVFSSIFGGMQLIRQKPLGRFIELTPSFSSTGFYTTDSDKQYRVSGYISHPVYFGSFLCILLPITIGIFLQQKSSKQKLLIFGLITILTASILGTLSRSTWINIAFVGLFFLIYINRHKSINLKFGQQIPILAAGIVFITLAFTLFSNSLLTRINSISTLMQNDNSGITRINMAIMSFKIFAEKPLTGIGLNNFTFEAYRQGFNPDFIAPPHNTILIFLVELGLPACLLFIIATFLSLKPKPPLFNQSPVMFGVWLGLITFVISSQFHPLFNLDPTFDLFMLVLGYYASINN